MILYSIEDVVRVLIMLAEMDKDSLFFLAMRHIP